ncbi:MAG: FGGY-family carbohydrate kinase [Cyanobacteria bacterium J06643_4]
MAALGIDFGTSGARAIALNTSGDILSQSRHSFAVGEVANPSAWRQALWALLAGLDSAALACVQRIAINGTSATALLCDRTLTPLTTALLYNDSTARSELPGLEEIAPAGSPTLSATSTLVKALWWYRTVSAEVRAAATHIVHQADWLAAQLHGQPGVSDYHNALKIGYDVRSNTYPNWLLTLPIADWLPKVRTPGDIVAPILPNIATQFGLPKTCQICAGTTDSIAAFLASTAHQPGDAVTSLGSTLVLKLLSAVPVDDAPSGVYSHRLGDLWLAGGASNTGGAVLRQYFSSEQLSALSARIDPSIPCLLDYYPLTQPGERFPINDPDYTPRVTPRPASDVEFLKGLLGAIARIECQGYKKLETLGAPSLKKVYTAGGGAQNSTWQTIRQQQLGVAVAVADQTEAAYGTALLALRGLSQFTQKPR